MKFLTLRLALLLFAFSSMASVYAASVDMTYSRQVEVRAVWVDRRSIPQTEQGIRDMIRSYAKAGINLVHPEVIYNGYSAYQSALLTQQNLWNGLDVLKIIIDEAHKHRMEVHPWVWVFRVGNANDMGGILKAHPDWVAVDRDGKSLSVNNGYWVCPSKSEVRSFLLNAFRELAQKYPIDGIQLDYIRFEVESPVPYCYNDSCREKFKAQHGIDPIDIQPFTKPVVDWHLWREELVNSFVAQIGCELRKIRPGIQISAAVGSIPDNARVELLQDWGHWADNKWVDFLTPMAYTTDSQSFLRQVTAASLRIDSKALISPGLGVFLAKTVNPMLEEVQIARSVPTEGVTLFASSYIDQSELNAFAKGPFNEKASLPFRSPISAAKRLISTAFNRLTSYSLPADIWASGVDLASAQNLLKYASYRQSNIGYVPPSPPPIFIPERIQPLPSADIPYVETPPQIDGRLDDSVWQKATRARISTSNLGLSVSQPTDVILAYDSQNLYIAFRAFDPQPDRVKAQAKEHDGPVFTDDSVEVFLSIPSGSAPLPGAYYHFAMNAIGTKFEQKVYDTSWNGVWQGASGRESDAWTAEIAIPFSSLGVQDALQSRQWRGNFCRNRVLSGGIEYSCWSETYGSYHTPIRFGTFVPVE